MSVSRSVRWCWLCSVTVILDARKDHTVRFSDQGANALLGTVLTLATLSLVMPSFTSSSNGPTFTGSQLAFSAVSSAAVYCVFVVVQTGKLRWMFLSPDSRDNVGDDTIDESVSKVSNSVDAHGDEPHRSLLPRVVLLPVFLALVPKAASGWLDGAPSVPVKDAHRRGHCCR